MKAILILFAFITPLLARIGETPEQCHARYGDGSPFEPSPDEDALYEKFGIRIVVVFRNGKCVTIIYDRDKKFSEAQIDRLQKSNHSGRWKITERAFRNIVQTSENGLLHSAWMDGTRLMITTVAETERRELKRKQEEIKALDGL
jgi:hypothetical protein